MKIKFTKKQSQSGRIAGVLLLMIVFGMLIWTTHRRLDNERAAREQQRANDDAWQAVLSAGAQMTQHPHENNSQTQIQPGPTEPVYSRPNYATTRIYDSTGRETQRVVSDGHGHATIYDNTTDNPNDELIGHQVVTTPGN